MDKDISKIKVSAPNSNVKVKLLSDLCARSGIPG